MSLQTARGEEEGGRQCPRHPSRDVPAACEELMLEYITIRQAVENSIP